MKFREIIFLDGDDARYPIKMIDRGWKHKVLKYLLQWDYGEGEEYEHRPWGTDDQILDHGQYVISYNRHLEYISLTERIN